MITAFELPGVVVMFVAGMLSDRYGRRWMVVPSLFLSGVAGTACALAPNFGSLVAAVTVPLGLGGAYVAAGALATVMFFVAFFSIR